MDDHRARAHLMDQRSVLERFILDSAAELYRAELPLS